MPKIISFDATRVNVTTRIADHLTVEIETCYLDEVLDEFSADEIIENYSDLSVLHAALREHYGDK